jgi:uncharacterized membrane protein YGL010W
MTPPAASAPFAEKLEYYRSQHTSRGVRATHLVGIPAIVMSLPIIVVMPAIGIVMLVGGWVIQIVGHSLFEKNKPALTRGPLTYQLTGLAYWCEEVGDMIGRRHSRKTSTASTR